MSWIGEGVVTESAGTPFVGLVIIILLFLSWMFTGVVGTIYISGQCMDHGYNGGGLEWDYTRYCNAEHFTTVPGPRRIPYSEVVR